MNKFIFIVVASALLFACSERANDSSIIERDKFVEVLVDIHIADATLIVKGYRINTDSTKIRLFYNHVLLKHDVTQKQIQNTFEYYSKTPKDFEKLYDEVSDRVVKLEEQYTEKIDLEE